MTLKPCPNPECVAPSGPGVTATHLERTHREWPLVFFCHIRCSFCQLRGPRASSKEEAERLWNALPRDTDDARAEVARLRKLFDDAGQGEHNVLALVDHYQRELLEAEGKLRAVCSLLERNGCDCDCDHDYGQHDDDCDVCLGCRISEVVS